MPAQGGKLKPVPRYQRSRFLKGHNMSFESNSRIKVGLVAAVAALSAVSLTGCAPTAQGPVTITVVSHDSFVFGKDQIAQFKKQTGITVRVLKKGDAGLLTNQLVLTKDAPLGDAVFGIDNTFEGVATSNGIIDGNLTAVDYGDVCFNYDQKWFADHSVTPPTSWRDLTKPAYKNLTVVENPATSSTGLSFLATTVAAFGSPAYLDYWKTLKANGLKVAAGWEDAYYTDFSGAADSTGKYPIVLSYSASPADEVRADGKSQTKALLNECFRQTEFAGVLKHAKHPAEAQKFVKYLLSDRFQQTIPGNMYVYPIVKTTKLPDAWSQFAAPATSVLGSDLDVNANRATWLKSWNDIFG
jgi:thiamine transport system substrate-binding protein